MNRAHPERVWSDGRRERAGCDAAEQLRSIAAASNTVLWEWDLRTNRTVYTPHWKLQLGYTADEIANPSAPEDSCSWFSSLHPGDAQRMAALVSTYLTAPFPNYEAEFRMRAKDGAYRWILSRASLLFDECGRPSKMRGTHVDITERKRVEEDTARLLAAQQEQAAVAGCLSHVAQELIAASTTPGLLDCLCRLTRDALASDFSHLFLFNGRDGAPVAAAACGHTAEQWEALRTVRPPAAVIERLAPASPMLLTTAQSQDFLPPAWAEGRDVTRVLLVVLPRQSALAGALVAGYCGRQAPFDSQLQRIAHGLGQLGALALKNKHLVDELTRASQARTDFVSHMSHELRTPLNVIIGYTDMLEAEIGDQLPAEQSMWMQAVGQQARLLLDLVEDALDLSRLESGGVTLQLQEVDVATLLNDVCSETLIQRKKSQVHLHWHVAADVPQLRTDPAKLRVVLTNLLGNAMKYTEQGHVLVTASARAEGVEVAVADTGIGIAPEMQSVIFEPFRQGAAPGGGSRGVGLGLYLVRRITELLGATIDVESAAGCGSTFRLWLPPDPQGMGLRNGLRACAAAAPLEGAGG